MRILILFLLIINLSSTTHSDFKTETDNTSNAISFFRGIYGCDPSVVEILASDDIILSYPLFLKLFNKTAFRGREEVKNFARGFCSRWKNVEITIHESIEENNRVVLLWSFKGTFAGPGVENGPAANSEQSWGGISLFRFNDDGKITAEIGEESTPGPVHRINMK